MLCGSPLDEEDTPTAVCLAQSACPRSMRVGSASTHLDCLMKATFSTAFTRGSHLQYAPPAREALQYAPLPRPHRRHVTTQERLFDHLHAAWRAADQPRPRVMVDFGCQAAHGTHRNLSDALLWLSRFNCSGSIVVGVDAFEDWAIDLQYRFDHVPPFSKTIGVSKRTYSFAVDPTDGRHLQFARTAAYDISCCGEGGGCGGVNRRMDKNGIDHMCRLTRMRMGQLAPDNRLVPSVLHPDINWTALRSWKYIIDSYRVPTRRADSFWRVELERRHIDFIKIDVDTHWNQIGLEGMLVQGAFTVATIEVDGSWGGLLAGLSMSAVDQLVWLARHFGYNAYLKVPCRRNEIDGGIYASPLAGPLVYPRLSTWYFPLANISAIRVTGFNARKPCGDWCVQDLLLIKRSKRLLVKEIERRGQADCMKQGCQTICNAAIDTFATSDFGPCADCLHEHRHSSSPTQ